MSSSKSEKELAALRSKVAQLEAKQKIQRMGIKKELMKMQQAIDKRDREKKLETKIEKIEAALENERRDRLSENEKRDRLLEDERRDRLLEDEKRDRLLEDERRERQAEKKEMLAVLENEKRDRLLEDERRERQAEKKEMLAVLENEKRDRLLEDERRERQAEKKDNKMMVALESERRERQAERKEMIATAALDKKEMMAALEINEREHQHQIEKLNSETHISQMEQQLLEVRAHSIQDIPISRSTIQHTVDPAPQRKTEVLLLQRIQHLEQDREQLKATGVQPLLVSNEDSPTHLQAPAANHQKALQPTPQKSEVVPHTSKISSQQAPTPVEPLATSTTPSRSKEHAIQISSQQASKPNEPSAASIMPSRTTPQQHKVRTALPRGNTKTAQGRPVPLPGDSDNHFFLSHCQSTGGDQTNAIYLELRQLGFACWYDNRADDLTKEGMRQGVVHAAAFLLFLSKGVLDRPFCEYFYMSSGNSHFEFTIFLSQASLRSERP
jgi:hypothetical protein